MKGIFKFFFAVTFLMPLLGTARIWAADTLVMPRELVDFGRTRGCVPITDFFDRPGMIDPPYVYGWLSGDKEESAVFWCKNTEADGKPYRLIFKSTQLKQLGGCASVIDWQDYPAGLSVERRTHLSLSEFRLLAKPSQTGPQVVVPNAKVLVNYYDGLTDVLYCYRGKWLIARTH